MPLVIEHRHEVAASAETLWDVIVDLDRYPEWNPFVVKCRSSLEPGTSIDMRVRVFPRFAQAQREQIFEHEPGRRLCYGLRGSVLGALSSRRCHRVTPRDAGGCTYVSDFELGGWLAPVVSWLLGRRLEAGFAAMSRALVTRAEDRSR